MIYFAPLDRLDVSSPEATSEEGLEDLKITQAIYESARNRSAVKL
jgi:hypothetical protein